MTPSTEEKAINWAVTVVGGFTASWTLLAWIRTTGLKVELPLLGTVTSTEAVIFSIPLVFCCQLALYFLVVLHSRLAAPAFKVERIPAAFGLSLSGASRAFRLIVFILFYIFPTAALLHFLIRLSRFELINVDTGQRLGGLGLPHFPPKWYDGGIWRWVTETETSRPSAFPGLQPALYALLVIGSVLALIAFIVYLSRRVQPLPPRNHSSKRTLRRRA